MEVLLIVADICAMYAVVRWSAKAETPSPKNDNTSAARRPPARSDTK